MATAGRCRSISRGTSRSRPTAATTPVALAQVIPGGFVAASQAIREQIGDARERLDVMNPYLTDRDMIERILAAARRGVKVRVVVSEISNNAQATAVLKHHYPDLMEAGVEVWELPGTVVHAKVVVADDVVSFGTVNLDAWALYRNSEIMMIAESPEAAALLEERLFEPGHRPLAARRAAHGHARAARELALATGSRSSSSSDVSGEKREQRLVDATAVWFRHRADDALAGEAGFLEHAFGRAVADVHVGGDALDAERERVLCEQPRDRRRVPAPARRGQHEVADLDDPPLHVEVVNRAAADDLAALGMRSGERQQPALLGQDR